MVNHAIDGKNNMGTTSPGNNSGVLIFRGSEMEIGNTINAKVETDKARLKANSAFLFSHFTETACKKAMTMQAEIFRPMMLVLFTMLEKSASLEKKIDMRINNAGN